MLYYGRKLLAAYRARLKKRRAAEKRQQELRQLREEIGECRRQMRILEGWYDLAADPHTVDSCIFQWCALQARYEALWQQIRLFPEATGRMPVGTAKAVNCIQYGKAAEKAGLSARVPQ